MGNQSQHMEDTWPPGSSSSMSALLHAGREAETFTLLDCLSWADVEFVCPAQSADSI